MKKRKPTVTVPDTTPLMLAAMSCDENGVTRSRVTMGARSNALTLISSELTALVRGYQGEFTRLALFRRQHDRAELTEGRGLVADSAQQICTADANAASPLLLAGTREAANSDSLHVGNQHWLVSHYQISPRFVVMSLCSGQLLVTTHVNAEQPGLAFNRSRRRRRSNLRCTGRLLR